MSPNRMAQIFFQEEINHRKVALMLKRSVNERVQAHITKLAKTRNWQIADLRYYQKALPADLTIDGAIIDELWDTPLAQQLHTRGCPMVRLGRLPNPHDDVFPAVVCDLTKVGRLAAEHFAARNFRHVGFVSYHDINEFQQGELYPHFRKRAEKLGCHCELLVFRPLSQKERTWDHADILKIRDQELTDWLTRIPKPIGILGFSDAFSVRVCMCSLEAGFSIPKDIAIISCGNDPLICDCTPVTLTGINTNGPEEADAAVELLCKLMNGAAKPASTVLIEPSSLTVRASTDGLATTDPIVADAVDFIWSHLRENISVEDVAKAIGATRRSLQRAFKDHLGRGVNAELVRRRLETCCELLQATDLSVADIVPRTGFRSTTYLHTTFRRRFGMTPTQWRAENADHTQKTL